MIHRHRSNRTEELVDALTELLRDPLPDAFEPEWLVVQGRGMGVWLSMELSRRLGVWADGAFRYPRTFVLDVLELALGAERVERARKHDRERTTWIVAGALPRHLASPEFARLRWYLRNDDDGTKRFALASTIADAFDRYLAYRPGWLNAWQRGDDREVAGTEDAWQAVLWREVVAQLGADHVASLEQELRAGLTRARDRLPPRVIVFGLSTMPPLYARILVELGRHTEVHVFSLSPTVHDWTDAALWARHDDLDLDAIEENRMLASMGRLGAETVILLAEVCEELEVESWDHDHYVRPDAQTVLGRLHADVFDLKTSDPGTPDDSIRLHNAHGPMREVEVLRDQLLSLVEGGVAPHEIVVMMPDVETYAPLIDAVFSRPPSELGYLPYRIADRAARRDSSVIDAWLRMLTMGTSRQTLPEVLDVLALDPVRERFGLSAADIESCARWLSESGVRWGIDAGHRVQHGLPHADENTWQFGLDRLLLGYATSAADEDTVLGAAPHREIEGLDGAILGRLAAFCTVFFGCMRDLDHARTLPDWRDVTLRVLADLVYVQPDRVAEEQRLRAAIESVCSMAEEVGFQDRVGIQVLRSLVEASVDAGQAERGFLAGGITFCAMVPMRTVPFEVVCLIGLDDGAFPRREHTIELDRMSRTPRLRGDRSRREDDRYLFLEAILSARRCLYLSHSGQSLRDNQSIPMSPALAELAEWLPEKTAVRHPLQPFSRAYFDASDARLFSYSALNRRGAESLQSSERTLPRPLFPSGLRAASASDADIVHLEQLMRFFERPVRDFMTRRLGLSLEDHAAERRGTLPLELDALDRYALSDSLLGWMLDEQTPERTEQLLRARGLLPPGALGQLRHAALRQRLEPLATEVRSARGNRRLDNLVVDARLPDGTRLVGTLVGRWEAGTVWARTGRRKAGFLLRAWIGHLVEQWQLGSTERTSTLLGIDEGVPHITTLPPTPDAADLLSRLVAHHRAGISEPLPFFPESSHAFASAWWKSTAGDDERRSKARAAAWKQWEREALHDPYLRRAYGDAPPLDEPRFEALALDVLGEMMRRGVQ